MITYEGDFGHQDVDALLIRLLTFMHIVAKWVSYIMLKCEIMICPLLHILPFWGMGLCVQYTVVN